MIYQGCCSASSFIEIKSNDVYLTCKEQIELHIVMYVSLVMY